MIPRKGKNPRYRKDIHAKRKLNTIRAIKRTGRLGISLARIRGQRLVSTLDTRGHEDWVFASPATRGHHPYWGQCIMRTFIQPIALKVGISKPIGWHTFRHTYSSLLRQNRTDIKVTQELLRHASSRVTLDTYTQAVTLHKRKAQRDVIRLLRASGAAAG